MPSKLFSLVLLLPALVKAANDWNTPCHDGSCSYHVANSTTNATIGSLFLNGSTSAISDLSPAAGWSLFDYDPSVPMANQTVRAICTGSNSTCSHLFNNGATDTVVRLPPGGASVFARVVSEWVHDNQTVPQDVKQKLSRRDGEPDSFVRGLILDNDFTAVNVSRHGPVSMHILATTGHDATGVSSRGLSKRDLFDHLKSIGAGVVNDVKAFNTAAAKELNHIEHAENQARAFLRHVARGSDDLHLIAREALSERAFWDTVSADLDSAVQKIKNATESSPTLSTISSDLLKAVQNAQDAAKDFNASHPEILSDLKAAVQDAEADVKQVLQGRGFLDSLKSIGQSIANGVTSAANTVASGVTSAAKTVASDVSSAASELNNWSDNYSTPWSVSEDKDMFSDGCSLNVHAAASGDYSYSFVMSGILSSGTPDDISMDFGFDADFTSSLTMQTAGVLSGSKSFIVFTYGYPLLSIPDVIDIGPSFQISVKADAGIDATSQMELDIAYSIQGAKLSVPGGATAGSYGPKNTNLQLSGGPGQVLSGDLQVHVIPAFVFTINIFNKLKSNVQLNLDAYAELDLAATQTGSGYNTCADVSGGLSINAVGSGIIFGDVNDLFQPTLFSKKWDIWTQCDTLQARRDHPKDILISNSKPVARGSVGATCTAPNTRLINMVTTTVPASDMH